MNLSQLVRLLDCYDNRFCHSLKEQLREVIAGDDLENLNPNAIKEISKFMERAANCGVKGAEDYVQELNEFLEEKAK